MPGILEILRAAVPHAAAARTGYLQGSEKKRVRRRTEGMEQDALDRQRRLDQEEQFRYDAEQRRKDDEEKRQGLLDASRMALEGSQAEENRGRARYYGGGGSQANTRTARRTLYIRAHSMPRLNPLTGQMEPGRPAKDVADEFDTIVEPLDAPPAPKKPELPAGTTIGPDGRPRSPYASKVIRAGGPDLGVKPTVPAATKVDTATKTSGGPLTQTREATRTPAPVTWGGARPQAPAAPTRPARPDSAALSKKYPFLFEEP